MQTRHISFPACHASDQELNLTIAQKAVLRIRGNPIPDPVLNNFFHSKSQIRIRTFIHHGSATLTAGYRYRYYRYRTGKKVKFTQGMMCGTGTGNICMN
jgi:hypothetical protein